MTTIAWDGEVLAGDSQLTANGFISFYLPKVKKIYRGNNQFVIFGFCGSVYCGVAFNEFFKTGEKQNVAEGDSYSECFAVHVANGKIQYAEIVSNNYSAVVVDYKFPFAIGSGKELAMAAMEHGASAIEAVEYASKRDIYTGGDIYSYGVFE